MQLRLVSDAFLGMGFAFLMMHFDITMLTYVLRMEVVSVII
jgi:hypothetical protein